MRIIPAPWLSWKRVSASKKLARALMTLSLFLVRARSIEVEACLIPTQNPTPKLHAKFIGLAPLPQSSFHRVVCDRRLHESRSLQ